MPMSSDGRAASSSGCAIRPREQETGSTGFAARILSSSPTGLYAMATAEHREPGDSRGACTVLGGPGGESPPADSTTCPVRLPPRRRKVYIRYLQVEEHRSNTSACHPTR